MFGQNPVRGFEGDGSTLQVREIFHTLQGEGPFSGRGAVFLRLTGCNLRCHFCDTKWDDERDKMHRVEEVAGSVWNECTEYGHAFTRLVVITGGEPLRQDISKLLFLLIRQYGLQVQIETAGTLWQDCLQDYRAPELTVVVSPKTPVINQRIRTRADAFKYVIRAADGHRREDGIPITNTQHGGLPARVLAAPVLGTPIYASPCDEQDETWNEVNRRRTAELALRHGFIAGVQLHKSLGLD